MPARFLFFAQISKAHTRAELPQDGAELHPDRAELHPDRAELHPDRADLHHDRADLHHDRADLRYFTESEAPVFLQNHEVLWFSGSKR